ncbi:MAG: hypothetical protein P8013_00415 [Candidatus Sulfobium sp.]
MEKRIWIAVICLLILAAAGSPAGAQSQFVGGYTFVRSGLGPQVCLGRWIPPSDVASPGTCEGQLVGVSQLTAVSTGQSADRLAQILVSLDSIDQRLAVSNDQMRRLIDATVDTQNSIDQQVRSVSEVLHETITRRFDELPADILASEEFKREITKLKEEILSDIEKLYPSRQTPTTK